MFLCVLSETDDAMLCSQFINIYKNKLIQNLTETNEMMSLSNGTVIPLTFYNNVARRNGIHMNENLYVQFITVR